MFEFVKEKKMFLKLTTGLQVGVYINNYTMYFES